MQHSIRQRWLVAELNQVIPERNASYLTDSYNECICFYLS